MPSPETEEEQVSLTDLSSVLWRSRELLELLLFKLEEEQLLLAAGRTRWLSHATREVDRVLEQLKNGEIARAMEVEATALDLHLPTNPSLNQLVEAAPAPWKAILADHREAFMALSQEITALAEANRDLLNRGAVATREALSWLGGAEPQTYSAAGTTQSTAVSRLLDRVI
jgi:flagellar biosynthesis/type III secretory pathway chaperone